MAQHLQDAGLLALPDLGVIRYAVEIGAVIVTKDEDFSSSSARLGAVRVVWLRIGNVPNRVLLGRVAAIWPEVMRRLAGGDRLIEVGP
jgi:predicted nuclease of predicted toxin-antitoxin system